MPTAKSNYEKIIETIFENHYRPDIEKLDFTREEIIEVADSLGISRPRNIGDVLYSYRYRRAFPNSITTTAPEGYHWILRSIGIAKYQFALAPLIEIVPSTGYLVIKIPDATPGIVRRYAMNDEQALLAALRYNRLIDIFTGLTCYSLQSHLRTTVGLIGQVETDELYVAVDRNGTHFVVPIQAKGKSDRIGPVQIEQDFAICNEKFPELICRPVAAQFLLDGAVALFEFANTEDGIRIIAERHYKLVAPGELSAQELATYHQYSQTT